MNLDGYKLKVLGREGYFESHMSKAKMIGVVDSFFKSFLT